MFCIAWLTGFGLGSKFRQITSAEERAARAERERLEEARAAVAEERARIARELHDVVGHSVGVMTVQAAGVRRLLKPEQEREREALLRSSSRRDAGAGRDAPPGRRPATPRGGAGARAAAEPRASRPAHQPGARSRASRRASRRGRSPCSWLWASTSLPTGSSRKG
ncbi:MAG: histidine kinase dimerization/phosphoacceptor domain-containing protein [Gaiellaceae bacterium]